MLAHATCTQHDTAAALLAQLHRHGHARSTGTTPATARPPCRYTSWPVFFLCRRAKGLTALAWAWVWAEQGECECKQGAEFLAVEWR